MTHSCAVKGCIGVALLGSAAAIHAQALPPPPASPPPVMGYEYDPNGNLKKTTLAPQAPGFGHATERSYDDLQRLRTITDARNGVVQLEHTGRGDLTKVTDPRQLVTHYPRNGLGDATSVDSPDTGIATRAYDEAGNLKTLTDSRGARSSYTYDALNRLTRVIHTMPGRSLQTFRWTYDQTGPGYSHGVGRLTSTAFPVGTSTIAYDEHGRILKETQRVDTGVTGQRITTSVGYTYDAAGRLTSVLYPSGPLVRVDYAGGLPSSVSLARNATAAPSTLIDQIRHEPFGAIAGWRWQMTGGAATHDRHIDASGRLVRYPLGELTRDLSYDEADRIRRYIHWHTATAAPSTSWDQEFSYDEVGRLTGITTSTTLWTIAYDANGNRTRVERNGQPSVYTVAVTSNRLTATTQPARSFVHDAAGNTTADGQFAATYDASGRLASLQQGRVTSFDHDTRGLRARKLDSTGAQSLMVYVYDQAGHLLGEYDANGAPVREYVWLGDTPLAVFTPDPTAAWKPPLVYYVHADHLDTPRVAVDTQGRIRWRWLNDAEPFGSVAPETNPSGLGDFELPLRMPGQVADAESGLFYNWHRDYDPVTGRYVQSDPIGLQGGINTYGYVEGNPLSYTDPLGLDRWGDTMCLPTQVYIIQSSGNGKDGPTWGAAGSASNDSPESPGFMTFPANSFPDVKFGSPGIADGTYYGTFGRTAHGFPSVGKRGPGVVLNDNRAIPTLGANPAQGGMPIADYVHMHCQNYGQSRNDTNRGSAGCITARGDYCERLWRMVDRQCNKNVIVHVIRN